jgi:ABC-type transport system involved in multi-copper enzyme maturation permease subunit
LIASQSVRHGIRGGAGLISLLFTLVIGLAIAQAIVGPIEGVDRMAEQQARHSGAELDAGMREQLKVEVAEKVVKIGRSAMKWAMDASDEQMEYLTDTKPVLISAFLVILMLFVPALTALGGFNQTAGDIASKGLRFLLIRTERENIYFGRFIGTFLFSAVIYAVLFLILALYLSLKIPIGSPGATVMWLAEGYLRVLVFSLPYMALCAWVSAGVASPFGSLVISILVVYIYPAIIGMAGKSVESAHYLQYATPWGFKWWLMMPMGGQFLGGVAAMLGFTALLLVLGSKSFKGSDL